MNYRADIDGLRAFAVLAVVAFHAFPVWLKGGYIGVDVFFVISGYLITRIIFENYNSDKFSFLNFYGRRIIRLFPALIIVMVTALGFGWFALLDDEYAQLGKHVFGGAIFISNFIYWDEAIGYLTNNNETKPMLHLWSLAVEEQFYIVWPLLIFIGLRFKINLLIFTVLIIIFSFTWNLASIKDMPTEVFYWPIGRFWELLSGSALAWLLLYKHKMLTEVKIRIDQHLVNFMYKDKMVKEGETTLNVMSFLGLFILTISVVQFHKGLSFPGGWAVFPVIGALFVIASGPKAWVNRMILMNPIAVWIGLISYPLYLWHWPILSFMYILDGGVPSRELRIFAVCLSVFAAWLTYKVIERPFRRHKNSRFLITCLLVTITAVGIVAKKIELNNGYGSRLLEFIEGKGKFFSQINSAGAVKRKLNYAVNILKI